MIELTIKDDCIKCGQCVSVCPQRILQQSGEKTNITLHNLKACIVCGHCVAICPTDSVTHSSFPSDKVHPIRSNILPSPDAVLELLRARRSNRSFSSKSVPMNFLDKILEAANLAPTASNSQSLEYTLVTDSETISGVLHNTMKVINASMDEINSSVNKEQIDPNTERQISYMQALTNAYNNGIDPILRNAKALLFIHASSGIFNSADANLAYQNASIMSESLGVAHFYTGFVCKFSAEDSDKEGIIRKALGINGIIYAGMALGMPKYTFKKCIDKKPQIVNKK